MTLSDVIGESWSEILQSEFDKQYMRNLSGWLKDKRENGTKTIYPDKEDVFRAFKLCPFDKVKVVILGQEPYYQGNADGLAFSYKNGMRMGQGMQALDVIFNEIEEDCYNGLGITRDYQLDYLAKQGVLLLNTVLTVFRGQVSSHKGIGWEQFTASVLQKLLKDQTPKVFMLWGKEAQNAFNEAAANISFSPIQIKEHLKVHLILNAYHPAYDLHKRDNIGRIVVKYPDGFTGCKHFSAANSFLLKNNIGAIDWFPIEKNHSIPVYSEQPPF